MVLFFLLLFSTLVINTNTSLHLLLTAELLWITLYIILLFLGMIYDNLNLLSLTFFFLLFSASEFGVGLLVLTAQHLFLRTINLNEGDTNVFKHSNRFLQKLNTNRIQWKFQTVLCNPILPLKSLHLVVVRQLIILVNFYTHPFYFTQQSFG